MKILVTAGCIGYTVLSPEGGEGYPRHQENENSVERMAEFLLRWNRFIE
jgi:hypothetical protein